MRIILFFIFCFSMSVNLYGKKIVLIPDKEKYEIWPNVEILVDKNGRILLRELPTMKWEANHKKIIQFGLSGYTYWFRFSIENNAKLKKKYYLDTDDTQTDILELYILDGEKLVLNQKAGRFYPESFRFWNKPALEISPPIGITEYYLKVQSQSYITFDLALRSGRNYHEKISYHFVFYGAYYAIIIAMILYNFFLFIGLKEKTYAFYLAYLFSVLAHQFFVDGFGVFFFGIGYKTAFTGITFLAAVMFASTFFANKQKHPQMHSISILLSISLVLWSGFSFFVHPQWYAYFITSSIFSTIVYSYVVVNGVLALISGDKAAKFFILGWLGLILFSAMYLGVVHEILPANFITINGIAIGSVYEAIVLSLSLAHRINETQREKEAADQKNLKNQIIMTESFARFVPREFLQYLNRASIMDIQLGDQVERQMSILFSDIRSFTSISEKSSPQETIDFLNSYFMSIGPIIRRTMGLLINISGMLLWLYFLGTRMMRSELHWI